MEGSSWGVTEGTVLEYGWPDWEQI